MTKIQPVGPQERNPWEVVEAITPPDRVTQQDGDTTVVHHKRAKINISQITESQSPHLSSGRWMFDTQASARGFLQSEEITGTLEDDFTCVYHFS